MKRVGMASKGRNRVKNSRTVQDNHPAIMYLLYRL